MWAFLNWWFGQLAGLLPGFLTRERAASTDAIILDVGAGTIKLFIRSENAVTQLGQAAANELGLKDLVRDLRERKSLPALVLFRVPFDWVLKKHLSFPAAARRNLNTLLGFEVDRETPFARDEIYWSYRSVRGETAQGQVGVELLIVPKRCIDPLLEIARNVGLQPSAVEMETAEGGASLVPLRNDIPPAVPRFAWPMIPRAAAAGALVLAVIAPFLYQEWAIASTDASIASIQAQADEAIALRRSSERLTRAADFFNKGQCCGSGLATLAAITRALPNDTYLTALQLRGYRLTISGLSPAAAQLVGLFAHLPLFKDPAFDSPVVGSKDGKLERFTISVSLAPTGQS